MRRACTTTALVILIAAATLAAASSVTGSWTITVEDSPHGRMTMGLTLEQKGTKVTGTFATPHGEMAVTGEFVDGALSLATGGGDDEKITLNAKLKDDGTLAGAISTPMGDMRWTAARNDSKDAK